MRCLTLANVLSDKGAECVFASGAETLSAAPALKDTGYSVIAPENINHQKPHLVIVDHYGLDDRFFEDIKSNDIQLVTIDDLNARDFYLCDMLLINTLSFSAEDYGGRVPNDCQIVSGPEHILIRPEFLDFDPKLNVRTGKPQNLFLFFGGTDPAHLTTRILSIIESYSLSVANIFVVAGQHNPELEKIEELCKKLDAQLHVQVSNMAEIMKQADLAVGCGGTTIWERLSLNLPTLEISHSDWQIPTFNDLDARGFIHYLGDTKDLSDETIANELKVALENGLELSYCPCGQGIDQLADQILALAKQ